MLLTLLADWLVLVATPAGTALGRLTVAFFS